MRRIRMRGERCIKRFLSVIFLVTLGGLGLVRPSFAAFVCAVSDSCATGVTVMRLWNVAGSHAEMSTQANYPKYVCCSGVDGLGNSCTGNHAVVARLSSATNARRDERLE